MKKTIKLLLLTVIIVSSLGLASCENVLGKSNAKIINSPKQPLTIKTPRGQLSFKYTLLASKLLPKAFDDKEALSIDYNVRNDSNTPKTASEILGNNKINIIGLLKNKKKPINHSMNINKLYSKDEYKSKIYVDYEYHKKLMKEYKKWYTQKIMPKSNKDIVDPNLYIINDEYKFTKNGFIIINNENKVKISKIHNGGRFLDNINAYVRFITHMI